MRKRGGGTPLIRSVIMRATYNCPRLKRGHLSDDEWRVLQTAAFTCRPQDHKRISRAEVLIRFIVEGYKSLCSSPPLKSKVMAGKRQSARLAVVYLQHTLHSG